MNQAPGNCVLLAFSSFLGQALSVTARLSGGRALNIAAGKPDCYT
ncbi:hypothetical protein ACIQAL_29375 [Pseudomonas sp. NPDC088368]